MNLDSTNLGNSPQADSPTRYPADQAAGLARSRVNELVQLLSVNKFDPQTVSELQEKIQLANELLTRDSPHGSMLTNFQLQSPDAKKFRLARRLSRIIRLLVALLLILLGFGMIIMPAPEYFEMFTLFYLNPNDGVTIMDIISLIVAFTGISLLITGLIKFNTDKV
jgi:magnesium-transporting ATPase (P-type)